MQKFDELILRELSLLVRAEFPERIFSITQVHVSKDLSFAKVWVSSVDDVEQLVKHFQDRAHRFRRDLAHNVIARRVPSLYFTADKTEEKASHIENLLRDIKGGGNAR